MASRSSPSDWLFFACLVFLPFMRSPWLAQNAFGIQGAKPINLLACCLAIVLISDGKTWRTATRLEHFIVIALGLYAALFTLEVFRSLSNLTVFRERSPILFGGTGVDFLLSYYVRPLVPLLLFFYALKRLTTPAQVQALVSALCISMAFLSVVIIWGLVGSGTALSNRAASLEVTDSALGLHYNTLATLYISCAPLLLYWALTRNWMWSLPYLLAAAAVLLLPSRSGVVIFSLSSAVLLLILRKYLVLVLVATILLAVAAVWPGQSVERLLSVGFGAASSGTLDDFLTGRLAYIWTPLLSEWLSNPFLLLFGAGRYGIITSASWNSGLLIQAAHAHNAFIDFFLDSGAPLLALLVLCLFFWLKAGWLLARRVKSPFYWALLMCVAAYLIGTPTERCFYPTDDNILLFPVLAALLNASAVYCGVVGTERRVRRLNEDRDLRPSLGELD